ncbi:MAG: hypothetical protein ACTS6H_02285, partial [Candidatus Hodgkinia cicadicola]
FDLYPSFSLPRESINISLTRPLRSSPKAHLPQLHQPPFVIESSSNDSLELEQPTLQFNYRLDQESALSWMNGCSHRNEWIVILLDANRGSALPRRTLRPRLWTERHSIGVSESWSPLHPTHSSSESRGRIHIITHRVLRFKLNESNFR